MGLQKKFPMEGDIKLFRYYVLKFLPIVTKSTPFAENAQGAPVVIFIDCTDFGWMLKY